MDMKTIHERLKTQNNRSTKNPLFVVLEEEVLPTSYDYSDDWEYADTEDGYVAIGQTKEEVIEYCKSNDINLPKDINDIDVDLLVEWLKNDGGYDYIDKFYYFKRDKFVQAFFTEKSADDYIEQNKHNLNNPRTYVFGMYRNEEMCFIRDTIMNTEFKD